MRAPLITRSETSPLPAEAPAGAHCLRCNYDLRGQPVDGRCPECGLAVRRSTADPSELHMAPSRWLGGLALGAALVLGAQALLVAIFTIAPWLNLDYRVSFGLDDAVSLFLATGVWLLTRPQRRYGPSGAALRWLLRLLAALFLLNRVLVHAAFYTGNWNSHVATARRISQAAMPLPFLLLLHVARLARRAGEPRLSGHCVRAGLGLTLSLLLSTALNWAEQARWFVTGSPTQAYLVTFCLGVAFYLWAMVSLGWFVFVFRRLSRASREAP